MNRTLAIVLPIAGFILLVGGAYASASVAMSARMHPSLLADKAVWLIIAGGAITCVGLAGLLRRTRIV